MAVGFGRGVGHGESQLVVIDDFLGQFFGFNTNGVSGDSQFFQLRFVRFPFG